MEGGDIESAGQSQDEILIKRVKAGDINAFEELVCKYKEKAYRTAYQMTNRHADADDLSQEAFIRAYRSMSSFNEQASFSTYLYRIVINLSINHLKKEGRHRHLSLNEEIIIDNPHPELSAGEKDTPREALLIKELHQEISKAIASLPLKERTVTIFSLLQGLSHQEIAEIEGCAEGTVSWRLFRARKRLRKKLQPYLKD